jgi:MFS family permease
MFGGFTFPVLANIFGRRRILLFGLSLGGLSILLASLCDSLLSLYSLFFVAGFGLSGYETVVYTYITEISALRFRSIASSLLIVIWSSSMLIYPFIVDILKSWRSLMMWSIAVPLLVTAFLDYLYFVESPRWLASKF